MDKLRKNRGVFRSSVTKTITEIENELQKALPDNQELACLVEKVKAALLKTKPLDDEILQAMLDADATPEELRKEQDTVEVYEDDVRLLRAKVEVILYPIKRVQSPVPSEAGSIGMQRNFKLPKIEIRKFDGEVKNWLSFWAQFQKIHEDETLHESDRFQYLVQAMVQGTDARELVESYPQTADNYPKVIQALKNRFGRDSLLVQVYVRELLKLVIRNVYSREKVPLSKMYVQLESHLRALSSLKLATTDPSTWLFPLVESSLPEEVMRAWQRSSLSKEDGSKRDPPKNTLDLLMEFLQNEVQGEQQIALATGGFFEQSPSQDKKTERKTDQTHVEDRKANQV